MRKSIIVLALFFLFCNIVAQNPDKPDPEKQAIIQVIQASYVDGLQNEGDTVKINQGFHPGFEMLIAEKDGNLKKFSISEWKTKIRKDIASGKLPRKPGEQISVKFLQVDVTGNAAVAKFEFYAGDKLTFVDYQFLYKFDPGWKIVSKIFYRF